MLFLFTYESNLHCTQYTSFKIAFFDMAPHIEEANDLLLIYDALWGPPLRLFFAVNMLIFLFYPIISTLMHTFRRISFKFLIKSNFFVIIYFLVNIFISLFLTGERIIALNFHAFIPWVYFVFFYGILSFSLKLIEDKINRRIAPS